MKKLKLLAGAVLICASFQAPAATGLLTTALPSVGGLTVINGPLNPILTNVTVITNRLGPVATVLTGVTNLLAPVTSLTGRVLFPVLNPVLQGLSPALPGLPSH